MTEYEINLKFTVSTDISLANIIKEVIYHVESYGKSSWTYNSEEEKIVKIQSINANIIEKKLELKE